MHSAITSLVEFRLATAGASSLSLCQEMSTLLSNLERRVFEGDRDAMDEFDESDDWIVIDWRGYESESLEAIKKAAPVDQFNFSLSGGSEGLELSMKFRERVSVHTYDIVPLNNFRVIVDAAKLMEEEFEIRGFRDRAQDDTNSLLLRPLAWWAEVERNFPKQTKMLFCDLAEMSRYWGIQGPASATDKAKPWWAFWR